MKEKFCKIHQQPYLVACMRCSLESKLAEAEGKNLPERFRDIANGE